MPNTALILLAHGARDPEWATTLRRVAVAAQAPAPTLRIALAFLELQPPSLAESAQALLAEGYGRIIVVPMFMAQGGHLKLDVPPVIDALRAAHPHVRFELMPPIGEAESVVQAMAAHVLRLASDEQAK